MLTFILLIIIATTLALSIHAAPYNPKDPNNCNYETFLMSRRYYSGSVTRFSFNAKKNPCTAFKAPACGGKGYYCQCTWASNSCQGSQPQCSVAYQCLPCPAGYTCTGNGFATKKNKAGHTAMHTYVDRVISYLRGGGAEVQAN